MYLAGVVTPLADRCAVGNGDGDGRCGRDGYAAAHGKRDGDADRDAAAHRNVDCHGDNCSAYRAAGNGDADPNTDP